ncbi:MAG: hypothetical protein IPL79_12500 [Myxococcales bacterium]|nr:hypothetical protein [Myxococcales bacterium]
MSRSKISSKDLWERYKRFYLESLSTIASAELSYVVTAECFKEFPRNLPKAHKSSILKGFRRIGESLLVAANGKIPEGQTITIKQKNAVRLSFTMFLNAFLQGKDPGKHIDSHLNTRIPYQAITSIFATLDAFLTESTAHILRVQPKALLSNQKKISWEDAVNESRNGGIIEHLIELYTYELGSGTIQSRIETINTKFGANIQQLPDDSDFISLMEQNRHLIVHNSGVVDKRYLAKTGSKRKVGTRISVTKLEVHRAAHALTHLINSVYFSVLEKFQDTSTQAARSSGHLAPMAISRKGISTSPDKK